MRIMLAGGGTAGHVTPLLAVASEIKKRYPESQIRYIGQYNDPMRHYLVSDNFNHIDRQSSILAGKWRRYHGVGFIRHIQDVKTIAYNLRDAIYFCVGFFHSTFLLLKWRPSVIFAKGGFVCLPVGLAAALLRIPLVTHDSDAIPGLTNRIISRYAKLIAVGLPIELYKNYYPLNKLRYTGIPLRSEFFEFKHQSKEIIKKDLGISTKKVLLVLGGSLGAVRLNCSILECLPKLLNDDGLSLIWQSGHIQFSELKLKIAKLGIDETRLQLLATSSDISKYMYVSDVVVSRAGATSIAELAALAKPIILVPNPILAGGHQTKNANILVKQQASLVISEQQLLNKPDELYKMIQSLLDNQALQRMLSLNLHTLAVPDAASKIVGAIFEVL